MKLYSLIEVSEPIVPELAYLPLVTVHTYACRIERMDKLRDEMSLPELTTRCMSEIQKYNQREPHNDQYCLEIFRRALVQQDSHAWSVLMERFHGIVLSWIRRHPQREAVRDIESEENLVAHTFERFWRVTVYNKTLEFNSLAGALAFLHACVNSVIIDTLRSQKEIPIPENFEQVVPEPDESNQRWEVIKGFIPNAREQRLAYLLYYCGLKPRQIVQLRLQEFNDVHEIYRLKRNIIKQFRSVLSDFQLTETNALAYANTPGSKDQLRKQLSDFQLSKTNALAHTDIPGSDEKKELHLFALFRTTLEANDTALIGKTYSVEAGISQSKPAAFTGEPFNLSVPKPTDHLLFNVLLHTTENIESISEWHKTLLYNLRNLNPQLVEFKFKVVAPGPCSLALNFYHEQRWLKTIRFAFDTMKESQLTAVTSEE